MLFTGRGFEPPISTQRTGYSSFYDPDDDEEFESVSQISGDKLVSICMWRPPCWFIDCFGSTLTTNEVRSYYVMSGLHGVVFTMLLG